MNPSQPPNRREGRVIAASRKLSLDASLAGLIGQPLAWLWSTWPGEGDTIVGWGTKWSGRLAKRVAQLVGADLLLLEDGFLRSVGRNDQRIGIAFDDRGIYYDATSDSRLFRLVPRALSADQAERVRVGIDRWRALGLSKYNDRRDGQLDLPDEYVLVIDQVRDDRSIVGGLASYDTFRRMLDKALSENPDAMVVLKTHPDSADDPAKRHFDPSVMTDGRIQVVADNSHISPLIAGARQVYAVTSQVGFEGLLWGKPVRCFGMPFYAGWGLTDDELPPSAGRRPVSLAQLVHAAMIDYPRYWNPVGRTEFEWEEAMELVGLNRRLRSELPPRLTGAGFSPWKKGFVRRFVAGSEIEFRSPEDVRPDEALLLWGRRPVPDGCSEGQSHWIEDGFLRSAGLGANLVRPMSLVIDGPGIYYDATRPSRLETFLSHHEFSDAERRRAAVLRQRIVALGLSKYNLSGRGWHRPESASQVVLVVGQVADDASIRFGSPELQSDADLLRRVREERPDAIIVYKPHPDVVAGLRDGGPNDASALKLADHVVAYADPIALLGEVDEVHVMTSLLGFEALIRGKPVTCHGIPFYAGWGLTDDRLDTPRRGRDASIDELVYAALIFYPRYVSENAEIFAGPECLLEELAERASRGPERHSMIRKALMAFFTRWVKSRRRRS